MKRLWRRQGDDIDENNDGINDFRSQVVDYLTRIPLSKFFIATGAGKDKKMIPISNSFGKASKRHDH